MPAGRPTDYNQQVADEICERLADGESLRKICAEDRMPNKATVFRWLGIHPDFNDQYAKARETQADSIFDEVLHIADTPVTGETVKIDGDGKTVEVTRREMIEHRRLQIDARKWMAGKLRPKKYGERLELEHGGEVAMTPIINLVTKAE